MLPLNSEDQDRKQAYPSRLSPRLIGGPLEIPTGIRLRRSEELAGDDNGEISTWLIVLDQINGTGQNRIIKLGDYANDVIYSQRIEHEKLTV